MSFARKFGSAKVQRTSKEKICVTFASLRFCLNASAFYGHQSFCAPAKPL